MADATRTVITELARRLLFFELFDLSMSDTLRRLAQSRREELRTLDTS